MIERKLNYLWGKKYRTKAFSMLLFYGILFYFFIILYQLNIDDSLVRVYIF